MRKLWIPVILGSLLISTFSAENVLNLPEDFYNEMQEYRVHEHSPKVAILPLLGLLGIVNTSLNLLLTLFSSTSKTEIVASITKLGFDQISQTTYIQFYKDFPASRFG